MRPMRPIAPRMHDPAPSLWRYRFQRLMMRPVLRKVVLVGVPLGVCAFLATSWYALPSSQARVEAWKQALWAQLEQRPEFMVTELAVTGADEKTAAEVAAVIDATFPVSSFNLDLHAIRARVEDVAAVETASARVEPGGVLEVEVTPREPVAVWRQRDGVQVIDQEGTVLRTIASRTDRLDLPLIAGDGAGSALPEALALFHNAGALAPQIRGLVRMGERRWDVILASGQRLLLPETGAVAALERIVALNQANGLLARDVKVVDLRRPDRPTLRLGDAGVEAVQQVNAALMGAIR